MNRLDELRITHPKLVDESIAAFDRIIAGHAKVGRDLEELQARIARRLDESAKPEGGSP